MRRRLAVVIFVSAGESFFFESEAREAYFPLANHFVTQKYSVLLWRREHRHGAECTSNYRAGGP